MNQNTLQQVNRADWPELIKEIAEVIGDEAALNLFIRFSGRHLNVPKKPIPNHMIEQTIGEEKFVLFVEHFGRELLKIPSGYKLLINIRNIKIVKDFLKGVKQCDLATKYKLTDRRISDIVNTTKI